MDFLYNLDYRNFAQITYQIVIADFVIMSMTYYRENLAQPSIKYTFKEIWNPVKYSDLTNQI